MLTPQEALITLNLIPGLGSVRIQALLNHFGSAEEVLKAPVAEITNVYRIGPRLAAVIADWQNCTNAQAEIACAANFGARIITLMDDEYPSRLREMTDAPIVLYVMGELKESDADRSVAIVGTRQATPYGHTTARKLGSELAEAGCTIISGLARGIDTAAHLGALDAGGRTIAVIGAGLAELYPPENKELAQHICNGHGAIVSEFPMMMRPDYRTFPQRNRVVAAWSQAVVVAEAPLKSGAIHTAGLCADNYGGTIFAVPGNINSPSSVGCHALIRDGAILCTSARDILSDMHWDNTPQQLELFSPPAPAPKKQRQAPVLPTDPSERDILMALDDGCDTPDKLCAVLALPSDEINTRLMQLRLRGLIDIKDGGRYTNLCR